MPGETPSRQLLGDAPGKNVLSPLPLGLGASEPPGAGVPASITSAYFLPGAGAPQNQAVGRDDRHIPPPLAATATSASGRLPSWSPLDSLSPQTHVYSCLRQTALVDEAGRPGVAWELERWLLTSYTSLFPALLRGAQGLCQLVGRRVGWQLQPWVSQPYSDGEPTPGW